MCDAHHIIQVISCSSNPTLKVHLFQSSDTDMGMHTHTHAFTQTTPADSDTCEPRRTERESDSPPCIVLSKRKARRKRSRKMIKKGSQNMELEQMDTSLRYN